MITKGADPRDERGYDVEYGPEADVENAWPIRGGIGGEIIDIVQHRGSRKIIQLISQHSNYGYRLFALCNDGTVWWKEITENRAVTDYPWTQLPEVPDD